jgi:acylpyruvate hydrolase
MKPPTAYVMEGNSIKIPMNCKSLHHEIELGVVIGSKCTKVAAADVMNHVGGYCLVS